MSITVTFSGLPAPTLPRIDLSAVARAGRPLLAPALIAALDAAGLGPFSLVLADAAAKALLAKTEPTPPA